MKVILAKKAGFCMGVRRAVETTLETVHKEKKHIATFGPLIHNPQVLAILEEQGVEILNKVPDHHDTTIIIRAHGVPPQTKELLKASGASIHDATCPRVVRVQVIIKKYRDQGYETVIIGDRNHAEVEGLVGYAGHHGHVVSSRNDVDDLSLSSPYIIVSQTTQDQTAFAELSSLIIAKFPGGKIFNTICDSTHKRQDEVRKLCRKAQAIVVVGGKNSANTQRLGEIARNMGRPVFMAETETDLDLTTLKKYSRIGVTAGASTPTWMINRIVRTIESTPSEGESLVHVLLYNFIWVMLASNLYVSLGGGFLAYACSVLQGISPPTVFFIIAFGYLFAMHNLNRFADYSSKKFNDPVRAGFGQKHRLPLIIASGISLSGSLFLAYGCGKGTFILLSVMSAFGVMYQVRFIPKSISTLTGFARLKEIPGSKTLLVALAWALVIVVIPALCKGIHIFSNMQTIVIFCFVLLLVVVRNALFDVFDVQGDRIVGKETLPVLLGEKRTIILLYYVVAAQIIMLVAAPLSGLIGFGVFFLIPVVIYLFCLTLLYDQKYLIQGPKLEFAIESVFLIAACLIWISTA